ncbi:MAG: hypothetical protein Kow0077_24910 [Anaerolineae bacterium]
MGVRIDQPGSHQFAGGIDEIRRLVGVHDFFGASDGHDSTLPDGQRPIFNQAKITKRLSTLRSLFWAWRDGTQLVGMNYEKIDRGLHPLFSLCS